MLLWHALLVALSACVALAHETPSCITEYNPDADYFPHKISVDEADLFSVVYMGHYKIVRNEATDETYVRATNLWSHSYRPLSTDRSSTFAALPSRAYHPLRR